MLHVLDGLAAFEEKKDVDENKDIWGVGNNMDLQKNVREMEESYWKTEWMEGRLKLRVTLVIVKKLWNASDYISI